MRTEFRERVFLPLAIPLGVLLFIGVIVAGFALLLLYNTREVAVTIAMTFAALILGAAALLTSRDGLGAARGTVVVLAALAPVMAGALFAFGVVNVTGERNIDRQPHAVIPPDAPVIVAVDIAFDTDELTLPADGEAVLVFENDDGGVPHNVSIYPLEGDRLDVDDPVLQEEPFPGVATEVYRFEAPGAGAFGFQCDVHPNMSGTVTFE